MSGDPPIEPESQADAVDQVQALLGLRDERFAQILDLVPHMIFVKDAEGRFLLANRAAASLYRKSVSQMIGRTQKGWHTKPHELQRMLEDDQRVLRTGQRIDAEYVFHNADGERRILQTTKMPYHIPGDDRPAVLGISVDITDRKDTELHLRRAHDEMGHRVRRRTIELDQFWAMSPDLLCTAGFDGIFKRLNPAWTKTLGWTTEELMSKPYIEFVHPDDRQSTIDEASLLSTGEHTTVAFTNRYQHKDGTYRWLVWNSVVMEDQKLVYAVARDVTDRREAEERFRTLVANIPGAVYRCACDDLYTMQFLSDAVEQITGYAASDFIDNRKLSFVDIYYKQDVPHIEQVVVAALQQHQPYDIEYRIVHRSGSIRWIYEKGQAVFDDQGRVLWLDGVLFDITEQKHAQQELARRTRELARSNTDLEEFAYAASHDLRAPLRAIANLSEWIEEDLGDDLPDSSQHNLTLLRNRVHRMQQLIDDLLTYSRVTRTTGQAESINLSLLIDDIVLLINPPQRFTIEYSDDLPTIDAPRAPLEQVLMNLVANAVKHHDRAAGHVRIDVTRRGREYEFAVADDGPGIDPEHYERIFKMFATLQSRDQREGSGMGLALVKKLVERLGGRIWVTENQPRGCVFHFTWPKQIHTPQNTGDS